ncbi:MAG TPA: 4Fe-4S dicluster domain-containing protein [Victivallales bacterium]|nr:4Fe-4S dicluster domain-containing protein [Victivallales bacterium]
MKVIDSKDLNSNFKDDVTSHPGGENLKLCFTCGTCTACCPVAEVDDEFNPRKIIRQIILGMRQEILSSSVIWRCVQCYSCTAKCPQNVKFREILRALREIAVKEGFVNPNLINEVEEIGRLSQKMRRDMVEDLVTKVKNFDEIKTKFETS